jgi:hypothetical protein
MDRGYGSVEMGEVRFLSLAAGAPNKIEIGAQHAPDVEWREFVEERGPQKRHHQRCSALKPKALTTDIMDSDSVNLGSNPGPPASY